ncbi:hypothetical protein AUC71_09165 [Methyloceanibacter marginalis]|jgi:hypothetical protein|uniref:SPW repeat-containing protein n=1 Tax=Methyloceanibacter marginalis TaxID=1774971 RepID=A0A1E3WER2_9HYPH|nr:hypothetical protein [Methyloceanibacter marginalis]ODS03527.1 hypothetical protein AUC71_09165 [Methyloceanibacter marginalis]
MDIRFVTRKIHAYLDYPVAFALIGLPFLLGLGASNPLALWLSVATGVAALVLTVLTDHETGILRVVPYSLHVAVDFMVGLVFVAAPSLFGFSGLDAWFYWLNGAAVLTVIALSRPLSEAREPLSA